MGKHGGKAPIPPIRNYKMGCAVGRALESIFPLADSVVLSFGHCPPQERHALCEHLLSDERAFSAACRMNKLHYPVIRVQRRVRL